MKVMRKVEVPAIRSLETWVVNGVPTLRVVTRTEDGKFVDNVSLASLV